MGTYARPRWTATTTERTVALGVALAALLVSAAPASAVMPPSYYPSGPQRGVVLGSVTGGGWTQCFKQLYNQGSPSVASVLAGCDGEYMLMAARPVNSQTFDLLAAARRADVVFDTGRPATTPDYDMPHDANGTGWYFNDSWSWGFAKQGDPVSRNACDFNPAVNVELRLCWHTGSGQMRSGYRSGATILNGSTSWERLIFVSNGIVNEPPAVTAAAADALGDEGDTLASSGSFGDADGEPLTLTADDAHGVFTAGSDGSWTWRLGTSDDVPRRTVTVTATDPKGAVATDSFSYGAANVAPATKLAAANPSALDESRAEHVFAYAISDPGRDTVEAVQTSCGSGGEKVDGSDAHSDSAGSFRCVFARGPARPAVTAAATDSDGDRGDADSARVTIADLPIAAAGARLAATEAAPFGHEKVASFSDPTPYSTADEYVAAIDWGDGASSAGTIAKTGPGAFDVTGAHTYADRNSDGYLVKVAIGDADNGDNSAAATSSAVVADAPIHAAAGAPITTSPAFTGPVATFTDEASGPASEFSAVVSWGDGSASSAAAISGPDAAGTFTVSGSHAYAATGPHALAVQVISAGGSTDGASTPALVYRFATPANASFAIGDATVAPGTRVTWWGSKWDKLNPFSTDEQGPGSFKGFVQAAASKAAPACGSTWSSSSSGGSVALPASVPAYMAVIVASGVTKSSSAIAGDVRHVVVVKTDPGYEPNPGHAGTGTIVGSVC